MAIEPGGAQRSHRSGRRRTEGSPRCVTTSVLNVLQLARLGCDHRQPGCLRAAAGCAGRQLTDLRGSVAPAAMMVHTAGQGFAPAGRFARADQSAEAADQLASHRPGQREASDQHQRQPVAVRQRRGEQFEQPAQRASRGCDSDRIGAKSVGFSFAAIPLIGWNINLAQQKGRPLLRAWLALQHSGAGQTPPTPQRTLIARAAITLTLRPIMSTVHSSRVSMAMMKLTIPRQPRPAQTAEGLPRRRASRDPLGASVFRT